MTKTSSTFEHRVGDKVFLFICDQEANTMEAASSLCHFMKILAQIEDAAKERQVQQEQCEAKVEDLCP